MEKVFLLILTISPVHKRVHRNVEFRLTMPDHTNTFLELFARSFQSDTCERLVLCAPCTHPNSETLPRKQTLRPIELKGETVVQWELQFDQLQTHLNLSLEQSTARFSALFGKDYREAYLFTADTEAMLRHSRQGAKLKTKQRQQPTGERPRQHNRSKNYLIPEGEPCPFLEALGIMTASGKVRESRQKKFRQINRYLEIVNDLYDQLPAAGPIRIVDFGCGLSYLTFAVHYLLTQIHSREVQLFGIDQKQDVIERCQLLAQDLNVAGMVFSTGRIEDAKQQEKVHLALSLHACDTATDAALAYAVRAEADVIMAVPCCQHEAFPQLDCDNLDLLLKHGILKERLAALATDALRAAALEGAGYKTQIMEFIDLEHTPKNLLIRAVKRTADTNALAQDQYRDLKSLLNLHTLATDEIFTASAERSSSKVTTDLEEQTP